MILVNVYVLYLCKKDMFGWWSYELLKYRDLFCLFCIFVFGLKVVVVCDWILYFGFFLVIFLDLFDCVFFLEVMKLCLFDWVFFFVVKLVLEVKLEFVGFNVVFGVVVLDYVFFDGWVCFLCVVGLVVLVLVDLVWLVIIFNVLWVVFCIECVWIY